MNCILNGAGVVSGAGQLAELQQTRMCKLLVSWQGVGSYDGMTPVRCERVVAKSAAMFLSSSRNAFFNIANTCSP